MLFDTTLHVEGSTCTQSMPIEIHIALIELLREIEPYFEHLEVEDEGGYWESGDREALEKRVAAARSIAAGTDDDE